MPASIPRSLVEYVLLGPTGDRRQLQDSPILGDVWIAFAKEPDKPQELLITPHRSQTGATVAVMLDKAIDDSRRRSVGVTGDPGRADVAGLHGIIAARLYFHEVLRIVVPRTEWWGTPRIRKEMEAYSKRASGLARLRTVFETLKKLALAWASQGQGGSVKRPLSAFERYAALTGLILWAGDKDTKAPKTETPEDLAKAIAAASPDIVDGLAEFFSDNVAAFASEKKAGGQALFHQVSLNRRAMMAIARSVSSVKADAARGLFKVKCDNIAWAVLDAGIHGNHPAFKDKDGQSRVKKSFDFRNFRKIVSLDNSRIFADDNAGGDPAARKAILDVLVHKDLRNKPSPKEAAQYLLSLADDMRHNRPVNWERVERFIEIKVETKPPSSDHGTHVAGIIGASAIDGTQKGKKKIVVDDPTEFVDGMCPDIQLYDFRVLSDTVENTEFAIIAALQYIRFMNVRRQSIAIHGANLSLSIPHDVRNYACGRTPVCVECERLVDSGVVVVAAAGNFGYQSFTTKEGSYEGYAAFSVTDPGNADGVITVGSTHRDSPHTYGVSFFSSRGPTGDGRLKPDLVAPGERIRAPVGEQTWDDLDGTSMAAPHVSGAAAMLMARYSEMVGQPRRIKQILCNSATDLGRERSFQGHGMLDVLRAFQSI